jgi:erythromycin esterase-like protein
MTPLEFVRDRARPFDEFRLPPETLAGKRLFFFGETHYIAETLPVKTRAIHYLVEEAGLRHIVIESDPIAAAMLDHYVATGDGGILDTLASDPVWGVSTSADRLFYESLRGLAEAGNGDRALRIEGYELPELLASLPLLCRYVSLSGGPSEPDKGILSDFLADYSKPDAPAKEVIRRTAGLLTELRSSETLYRGKLGPRYDLLVSSLSAYIAVVRITLAEVESAESSGGPSDDDTIRERVLAACIADLYRSTSDGIVVWYGATHIDSKFGRDKGPPRLGGLLRSDEEMRRASLTTILLYANCEIAPPDAPREQCHSDFPYDVEAIAGDLPYDVSFLATHGQGSPFDTATGKVRPVSQYADYLIVIRPDHGE